MVQKWVQSQVLLEPSTIAHLQGMGLMLLLDTAVAQNPMYFQPQCYSSLLQEFMREARIMVTLNHPCIVRLIGVTRGKPMMLVSFI